MKVRINARPRGCFGFDAGPLRKWTDVAFGAVLDIPPAAAEGLIAGGFAEKVARASKAAR